MNEPYLDALLGPVKPKTDRRGGRPPYTSYRRIRTQANRIIEFRESEQIGITEAAEMLGFKNTTVFEEAYQLLKRYGAAIKLHDDWSGVETELFAKFPGYRYKVPFVTFLEEVKDPRAGRYRAALKRKPEMIAPAAPMPAAPSPEPASDAQSTTKDTTVEPSAPSAHVAKPVGPRPSGIFTKTSVPISQQKK